MRFQPLRDRYHPQSQPERSTFKSDKGRSGPSPNTTRSDRQSDRGSGSRGLQVRNSSVEGSDTGESPKLSEYYFNVDSAAILAAIGRIEGRPANIIRWKVVEQLGLLDHIVPAGHVLKGFNMAYETTKSEITLPVNVAGIIQHIKCNVSDGEMRYNALLGRSWPHIMRAVPSTLHQMLKFPTSEGVKIIHGEQPVAKEMFAVEEAVQTSQKAPDDAEDTNEVENAK
ncbi:uncharacterized protein LOC132637428 [Lycium barbarum]|uniref:uncharacterized protein LOC132637428 n=1 Tax=Lycium barbarum TaxID=112863 RepID=UPI00293ED37A|nr:uncharacterized protein LOC132637428 [Lycium barbarum]